MQILKTGRPTNKEKAIAQVREIDEAVIRMNFNVPKHFHKQIKQRALDEDTTVTELICKAVKEYMSK